MLEESTSDLDRALPRGAAEGLLGDSSACTHPTPATGLRAADVSAPSPQAIADQNGAPTQQVLPQGEVGQRGAAAQQVLPQGEEISEDPAPNVIGQLPEWLVKLATESWQAELLISGFAIVGTFQLIGVIQPMVEWAVFTMRAELLDYVRWAIYYFSIGLMILPAAFVAHFALRTYWVGLVGLSSVYPHGFGKNFGMVPEFVARDTAMRQPPLAAQIDQVDQHSSLMFALAALSAMVFASIALVITVQLGVAVMVERLTNGAVSFKTVFWIFAGGGFAIYLLQVGMLSLKRYHSRPHFQRAYLLINRSMTKSMYTVFAQPAAYLSTLITTNATGRTSLGPMVFGAIMLFVGISYIMKMPLVIYLLHGEYITEDATRADTYEPSRYWAEWREGDPVSLLPSVPSEYISSAGGLLPVFVPMIGEEEYRIDERFAPAEQPDSLDRDAWRSLRREDYFRRAGQYFRLRLDNQPLAVSEVQLMRPTGRREGLRLATELPSGLAPGRHVIYLDRPASLDPSDQTWEPRAAIPVWVEDANAKSNE